MKNIFTILFFIFLFAVNLKGQWTQQISPVTADYNTIYYFDENNGWAFGSSNSVKTTNGGINWVDQSTSYSFKKVSVVNQNNAFAIVGDKSIYSTTDAGATWIMKTTPAWAPPVTTLDGISFLSSTTGYVGGTNGYIFKTTNGGTNWSLVSSGGYYVSDLFFIDENNGFSCRWGGQWSKTTDGGANWTGGTLGGNNFYSVFAIDANNVFLAGASATIYATTNGGTNWTQYVPPTTNDLYSIRAVDAQTIWAAGTVGAIVHSTNGGTNWSAETSGVFSTIKSLFFINSNTGWACGTSSTLLKYSHAPVGTLTVTSPNGGEEWEFGASNNITWTSSNITNVKIEVTTDNGTNWNVVIANTNASSGSYSWLVNYGPSANCKIRISDISDSTINDLSENTFTIYEKLITLTSPNGGESWKVGSQHNITWTSNHVTNVTIFYQTSGTGYWTQIADNIPADGGSYSWTIPNTASTTCKVQIWADGDDGYIDESDNTFTIYQPTVNLAGPNGGEDWQVGSSHNINWTSNNVTNVKLEYTTNNGTNWITITGSTAASAASYIWTIPNSPSANCKVRISDADDASINDLSDAVFIISAAPVPVVALVSPNGGEQWKVGSTQVIIWTSSNVDNVKLEYTANNGTDWITIISSTIAALSGYSWTIPNTPSANCKVRISNVTDETLNDVSDKAFTIYQPTVALSSPNGGESWKCGTNQNITWVSNNVTNVKLEYTTNNGTDWITIIGSVASTPASYNWTIPNTPSTSCKVRISDVDDTIINDVSDNVFTIFKPSITIISPNGGENWLAGTVHNITWTSNGVNNVRLYYSTNGGANWTYITNTPSSIGSYSWTIPTGASFITPSANCRIKIADDSNLSSFDISDSVFTISKLELTAPNGGENWAAGTQHSIHWLYSNTDFYNVKLEYTANNGSRWTTIINSTPISSNAYNWTIPDNASTQCRVRISNPVNPAQNDSSDDIFSIIPPMQISVISPNGGEIVLSQKSFIIKWLGQSVDKFKLEYTTNNGTSWVLINNVGSETDFSWRVPKLFSTNCKIKISSINNPEINDLSDNVFEIYNPVYGDVDLNNLVQAYDAASILKYLIGSLSLTRNQKFNANVSMDTTISAFDASLILKYKVHIIDSLPSDLPGAAMGRVLVKKIIYDKKYVDLILSIAEGKNINSFEGTIRFDSTFTFSGIEWLNESGLFMREYFCNAGEIKFAVCRSDEAEINDEFAKLRFESSSIQNIVGPKINLALFRFNEDNQITTEIEELTPVIKYLDSTPDKFMLNQNFPNPFNASTKINYSLPVESRVSLQIFNSLGKLIEEMKDEAQTAGSYSFCWNAAQLSSGIYFIKLNAEGIYSFSSYRKTIKAIILK